MGILETIVNAVLLYFAFAAVAAACVVLGYIIVAATVLVEWVKQRNCEHEVPDNVVELPHCRECGSTTHR